MGNGTNAWLDLFATLGLIAFAICIAAVLLALAFTAVCSWIFGTTGLIAGGAISLVILIIAGIRVLRR